MVTAELEEYGEVAKNDGGEGWVSGQKMKKLGMMLGYAAAGARLRNPAK
jgi:hypothetical protein